MNKMLAITGASLGIAAGSVYLILTKTSERKRNHLKRHTGKAVHAMGDMIEDITSMIK